MVVSLDIPKLLSQFFADGLTVFFSLQLLHKHQLLFGAEIQAHPCSQPPGDWEAAHLQECKSTHLHSHFIAEVFRRLENFLTVECMFWRAAHDNKHSGSCVLLLMHCPLSLLLACSLSINLVL